MNRILIILATLIWASACAEATQDAYSPETETVDLSDSPADSLAQLRVRADGMTIWAEPRVQTTLEDWLFQFRSSHSLSSVSAQVGNSPVDARLVSARKIEVMLSAQQMTFNLGEEPLIIRLETVSGKEFHVMAMTRARFLESTGSSKIYPWRNILPIMKERKLTFRGRVSTPEDFVYLAGRNDDDSEPDVARENEKHWTLDWFWGSLTWAAHPTEDALSIVGETADGKTYVRNAPIHMEIVKLGVTNLSPADAWPTPACEPQVLECASRFNIHTDDLETCGTYAQVESCTAAIPVDDTPLWVNRFASGLRRALISHYAQFERDIVDAGGNTRIQALMAVDTTRVEEVTDPEYIPSGHSLDDYRVFSHPDITHPGSDIVWFGIYDRISGDEVEVYWYN